MAIVKLYDIDEDTLTRWAITYCSSFCGWLIYENSDAFGFANWEDNTEWMVRYEFEFADEHEAMLFQLKWQGH